MNTCPLLQTDLFTEDRRYDITDWMFDHEEYSPGNPNYPSIIRYYDVRIKYYPRAYKLKVRLDKRMGGDAVEMYEVSLNSNMNMADPRHFASCFYDRIRMSERCNIVDVMERVLAWNNIINLPGRLVDDILKCCCITHPIIITEKERSIVMSGDYKITWT